MNTNPRTRSIALGALLAATVTVATMLSIPVPGFRLYFNMGEGVIYLVALLLGGRYGAICGGIGASLGDLILGYPLWAPLTLLIKGAEGYLVGKVGRQNRFFAILVGAIVMIAGYTFCAGLMYGWRAAPVEFVTDLIQTGIGAIFALAFVPLLERRLSRFLQQAR